MFIKKLAHVVIMEAEKSHSVPLEIWRSRKSNGVILSKSKDREPGLQMA